nr:hypothetical protein [Bosea sp. CRIB-10]
MDHNGEAQRRRPTGLACRRGRPHRRGTLGPACRTVAVELANRPPRSPGSRLTAWPPTPTSSPSRSRPRCWAKPKIGSGHSPTRCIRRTASSGSMTRMDARPWPLRPAVSKPSGI